MPRPPAARSAASDTAGRERLRAVNVDYVHPSTSASFCFILHFPYAQSAHYAARNGKLIFVALKNMPLASFAFAETGNPINKGNITSKTKSLINVQGGQLGTGRFNRHDVYGFSWR